MESRWPRPPVHAPEAHQHRCPDPRAAQASWRRGNGCCQRPEHEAAEEEQANPHRSGAGPSTRLDARSRLDVAGRGAGPDQRAQGRGDRVRSEGLRGPREATVRARKTHPIRQRHQGGRRVEEVHEQKHEDDVQKPQRQRTRDVERASKMGWPDRPSNPCLSRDREGLASSRRGHRSQWPPPSSARCRRAGPTARHVQRACP